MIDVITAKTHPPEYQLHKYWARKPHNVLNTLIKELVKKKNGSVLDPFCGSGVFLREASKLGHTCYGYDVNPVAKILSDTTCNPPEAHDFQNTITPILEKFKLACDEKYRTKKSEIVRYYVHETIVKCPSCNTQQTKSMSEKFKSSQVCHKCKTRLSFGLGSLIDTNIVEIITEDKILVSDEEIKEGKKLESLNNDFENTYDINFPVNNRILSFEGLITSKFFTKRNFYLLTSLADEFHKIKDLKIKEAALLLLTASSAQCSRLIAYRNNLSTGGPAWSVPGFWVPSTHLETNPYKHIIARYRKFIKGLEALSATKTNPVIIKNTDCLEIKNDLIDKIDLIFLDPPYGDSVPYMEFSMIWNSFLKTPLDIDKDISVSDRQLKKNESWENYRITLIDRIKAFKDVLADEGKILITFNNHNYKAWESLLEGLQKSKLKCISTMYQIPAVISSKAQFSKDGSYISDIYSVYKFDDAFIALEDLTPLINELKNAALIRNKSITKSVLYRAAFTSILNNNISFKELKNLDLVIEDNFRITDNSYVLKEGLFDIDFTKSLKEICINNLNEQINTNNFVWEDYYKKIVSETKKYGIPDASEILMCIGEVAFLEDGELKLIDLASASNSQKPLNLQ